MLYFVLSEICIENVENVKLGEQVNLPKVYGAENWSSLLPILN